MQEQSAGIKCKNNLLKPCIVRSVKTIAYDQNCVYLNQSELSNFFMDLISLVIHFLSSIQSDLVIR